MAHAAHAAYFITVDIDLVDSGAGVGMRAPSRGLIEGACGRSLGEKLSSLIGFSYRHSARKFK
jgi:hypothetical protein